jgi:hypothetical protein
MGVVIELTIHRQSIGIIFSFVAVHAKKKRREDLVKSTNHYTLFTQNNYKRNTLALNL